MKLDGKTVLITGGSSGIGYELARLLADRNRVVIVGRDETKLDRAQREVPGLLTRRVDIASETDAAGLFGWMDETLGGLDVLVNNAGLFRGYDLSVPAAPQMSTEDVEINVLGTVRMTRLALPLLAKSPESAIVFVSSAVALGAVPGFAVYGATKAAVHSFARTLRAELADSDIAVFDVLPPIVDTGASQGLDVPKLSPGAVADAIVQGVERGRTEIRIGRIRQLALIARFAPGLADRLLARALAQP